MNSMLVVPWWDFVALGLLLLILTRISLGR
jgi:hypothetical protein